MFKMVVFLIGAFLINPVLAKQTVHLVHPAWEETLPIENNRFCRNTRNKDCANVVFNNDQLIVKWDKWPPETFIRQKDGYYVLSLYLVHPLWEDTVIVKGNRICRSAKPDDCASIRSDDDQLTVKWDKWSQETFIRQKDGRYYVSDKNLKDSIEERYASFGYSFQEPMIVVNPYNKTPLAALIKFPTEKKARITLTVHGKNGAPDISHTFPSFETEHSLPVLGLYANDETTVTMTAEFEDKSKEKSTVKIKTGSVNTKSEWIVLKKTDKAFYYYAGYGGNVFDEEGFLRYAFTDNGWHHVYYFKDKAFVEHPNQIDRYSLLGKHEMKYNYPPGFYTYIHGMGQKPNGNLLVFGSFNNTTADFDGQSLPTHRDFILEFDYETGQELARYDLAEMLNPNRSLIVKSTQKDFDKIDWAHTNGISYDAQHQAIVVSGRHFGIAKIDEKTKKLMWWFTPHQKVDKSGRNGENGPLTDKMLTVVNQKGRPYGKGVQDGIESAPDFKWPLKTHNVLYAGNGVYSIFDNSGELFDKKLKTSDTSFASVYKIDDKTKTVRQIFKKDLKLYAETGSIVYVHPNQKEIWVEADNVLSKHNISLKNSYFTRFDKNGKTLYSVILPYIHCYAVLPFKFYQENIFYPL